jgi:redox-sensitive bicupin YhaK (pirin superfamily)
LQTVSWLFTGEIEHSDSGGVQAVVRPGELNLMTGGHGICHSEVATSRTTLLHGVQLWAALPDTSRDAPRDFQHYAPPQIDLGEATARVFLGTLAGQTSPVRTFSPLLGAEIVIDSRAGVDFAVASDCEHGLLVDTAAIDLAGTRLVRGELGYVGTGVSTLRLANPTGAPARVLLLGGAPFDEEIVMWWNFVARRHDEIVAFRQAWQNESERFGRVEGYHGKEGKLFRLSAPPLPTVRILPRRNAPKPQPE